MHHKNLKCVKSILSQHGSLKKCKIIVSIELAHHETNLMFYSIAKIKEKEGKKKKWLRSVREMEIWEMQSRPFSVFTTCSFATLTASHAHL